MIIDEKREGIKNDLLTFSLIITNTNLVFS